MHTFRAAIYVTTIIDGCEQTLKMAGLMPNSSEEHWQILIADKVFRIKPDDNYLLDDAVWFLMELHQKSPKQIEALPKDLIPYPLENEYGYDYCMKKRRRLVKEILRLGWHIKFITWSGWDKSEAISRIDEWHDAGIHIMHVSLAADQQPDIHLK